MVNDFVSLGTWPTRRALMTPERCAVVFGSTSLNYLDVERRSIELAGYLSSRGVCIGDRVAVLSQNHPDLLCLFFACCKIGAVLVPVNWRLAPAEVEFILSDCSPRVFLTEEELVAARFSGPMFDASLTWDTPAMIVYTSGTTGNPKGAVLSHGSFFWAALNILLSLDVCGDDRSLMVLPMFHIGGWNVNTLPLFWKGGTIVLHEAFDAGDVLSAVRDDGITWLMGVPATYLFLREHSAFASTDFSRLRFVLCGGAPAPLDLIAAYEDRGVKFIQGYGLTEIGANALCLPAEFSRARLGSAGRPYFYTDVRLRDDEIQLRGPSTMNGYHGLAEATADAFTEDGWLRTGDVGRQDEDGFFYVVDRLKDMIITGGENVYPAEVENVLSGHPLVVEVGVIGVPDPKWGESVRAVVVSREALDPEALISWSRERLAHYKCPRSVVFVDELPRTPSGKIQKPELRKLHG